MCNVFGNLIVVRYFDEILYDSVLLSHRLLLLEGGPGSPSCLLGGKHIVSWGFEDMLPAPDSSAAGAEAKGRILLSLKYSLVKRSFY